MCVVNRPRRRGAGGAAAVAARCHAAQPRRVHRKPALNEVINRRSVMTLFYIRDSSLEYMRSHCDYDGSEPEASRSSSLSCHLSGTN